MELLFDLAEDELQIFLAEADEHLQTLDEGLVRLEREGEDAELLQAIFRAAHTLKGSAGMIGHRRMADLTHALENIFDGLRRNSLAISASLVDACLESLDVIKILRNEVAEGALSPVDIDPLRKRLLALGEGAAASAPVTKNPKGLPDPSGLVAISADIASTSAVSAARAFQILLALQALGEVPDFDPPQAVIETAAPVHHINARVVTSKSKDEISKVLLNISEIDSLTIEGETIPINKFVSRPPPSSIAAPKNGNADHARVVVDKTVRTSVGRLDNLMNLVGELITDRNRLFQARTDFERRFRGDEHVDNLAQTILHVGRITDQLQEEVMRIRMLPIANVFNKFPRLVRDLSRKADKQMELVTKGEDTELDRSVIEVIDDPLIHLIRNSVDHGIEPPAVRVAAGKAERGTITLTARHEESRIIITVEDDGRGIDVERVKASAAKKNLISEDEAAKLSPEEAIDLIFLPGLSTADKVSDVSGRGVGMDIVRTNIERLSGNVTVETWAGRGTRFQIALPLTLAIIQSLLVDVGRGTYAIPLAAVMETLRIPLSDIHTVRGKPLIRVRDHILPLVGLSQAFGFTNGKANGATHRYVVAVKWGKLEVGLMVDKLLGTQEVVIKSLGVVVGETPGVSGAAILGDGRVALIVDVPSLFKMIGA
ncbi:MAG: chemotaxis protein CheA [Chloroflexota bacterium]